MKKKKNETGLSFFIKGFITGLGIIFPISASYLAVGLGIYKRLLDDINDIKNAFKNDFKFLLFTGLGIVISAMVSCVLINFTLKRYPIATLLFFIGLIMGGVPILFKKTNKEFKIGNIIWTVLGILILVGISFLGGDTATLQTSALGLLTIFGVGALAAGSMIVPGVSGSVILVILGYYEPMLEVISDTLHFNNLGTNMLIIIIFMIGMIIGILIVSKIMKYFLEKHERKTYFAIIGFVLASCINVIIELFKYPFNIVELVIGIVLFAVGFILSVKYLKED